MQKIIVESVKNYIVKVRGEYKYCYGQIFKINAKTMAMLISAYKDEAFLMIDTLDESIKSGDHVVEERRTFSTITKMKYFGNIINIHGDFIHGEHFLKQKKKYHDDSDFSEYSIKDPNIKDDGKGQYSSLNKDLDSQGNYRYQSRIFNIAPDMKERLSLNEPLLTGIFAIDLLIPLGKGQRQLILGNPKTGKTSIVLSTILNQKNNDIKIIYTCIGTKSSDLKVIYNVLEKNGLMEKTIIIYAPSDNIFQQYLAPYIAMAHAENLKAAKEDVVIVFDDLSNHANAIREAALLIDKPVGKEAFPGDLFYSHSSLLERAGKFKNGASITAFPIVRILNDDVTSLLATNVISITDGQIVLNSDIQASGIYPAIDINLSVSRTGSKVQNPILNRISGEMYKIYTQYKLNNRFDGSNYDFSDAIKDIIKKGHSLFNILKQDEFTVYLPSFILLLSYVIEWRILEDLEANEAKETIWFIYYVVFKTYLGQLILKTLERQESYQNHLILKSYIVHLVSQYERHKAGVYSSVGDDFNVNITRKEWRKFAEFMLEKDKGSADRWMEK